MSKNKQTNEGIEDVFQGFSLLDKPTGAIKDDELSEAELAALEAAAKGETGKVTGDSNQEEDEGLGNTGTEENGGEGEQAKNEAGSKNKKGDDIEESSLAAYAKYMSEKNILDLNDDDNIETEEDLERVQERTIQKRVNSYKEALPEDGQKFLEFIEAGGKPSDFHKYYYGDNSFENFSIESEEDQKYAITEALKLEGYSEEEIEDEINDAVDLGKLEKKAQTHLKKLQKVEKDQKAHLLEAQKSYAAEQEAKRNLEWKSFKDGLFEKEAIGGFKITPKAKSDLWDYMTKVVDKKTGETAYNKDSDANEDARYVFAYLLKNKWDVKSLERMVETKVTGNLRGKLGNFTDSRNKIRGGNVSAKKEDASGHDPFSGFKQIIN